LSISTALEGVFVNYNSEQTHFLGNGIGASILSFVSRNVGQNGNFIGRLTGLNPSRISLDALFVDTIHTEGGNNLT
jgi:Lipase